MAMKLAIVGFLLVMIGVTASAQQPAQPSAQSKPAALNSASIPALKQRAESGDAQAQFELGRAYEDGGGVAQDDAQAVEWFRKSAEQGNAQGENSLGVMYAQGRGVSRDREEAVRWYRKAAKIGLPEAMYNIAISYYNGEGIDANLSYAATWMMLASRKGDAQATEALKLISQELNNRIDLSKFQLAKLYEKGNEIPQDLPAAISLYTELGGGKDYGCCTADSRYKLCQFYFNGTGVAQDYARARPWCEKSGVAFSYEMLGRMAEQGLGQPRDLRQATEYYKTAALRGIADGYMDAARLEMASGAHDGEKHAYFWYYLAARSKIAGSEDKLHEAAARLNKKEIAEQQRQVEAWFTMRESEKEKELKKH
jgi:TPR repeat protein